MKRLGITVLAVLSLFVVTYGAQNAVEDATTALPVRVLDRQIDNESVTLTLEVAQPIWATVGTEENPAQVAEFINGGFYQEENQPMVPMAGRLFRMPTTGGAVVEILNAEYETISGVDYATFTGDDRAEELRPAWETKDEWFPGNIAELSAPTMWRVFRVSKLNLFPVQVNTRRKEARVYHSIQVRIRFEGEDERAELPAQPTKLSRAYIPGTRNCSTGMMQSLISTNLSR